MSIENILKNVKVFQAGAGKNMITALYIENTKPDFFYETKTIKKAKTRK